jgi:hypothetical protein
LISHPSLTAVGLGSKRRKGSHGAPREPSAPSKLVAVLAPGNRPPPELTMGTTAVVGSSQELAVTPRCRSGASQPLKDPGLELPVLAGFCSLRVPRGNAKIDPPSSTAWQHRRRRRGQLAIFLVSRSVVLATADIASTRFNAEWGTRWGGTRRLKIGIPVLPA